MLKVLIVEDEFLVRVGLRSSIDWSSNGFELMADATDGEEALDIICRDLPDIVLLDIQLPKIDGLEVLRRIKELNIQTKVLVISCNSEFEPVKQAMSYGAVDYLRKFILSPQDILNALQNIRNSILKISSTSEHSETNTEKHLDETSYINVIATPGALLPDTLKLQSGNTMYIDVDDPTAHFFTVNNSIFSNLVQQSMHSYGADSISFHSGPSTLCVLFKCGLPPLSVACKIQEQIMHTIGTRTSIGIGCNWTDGESLRDSLTAATQIRRVRFYNGGGMIREFNEISYGDEEYLNTDFLKQEVKNKMKFCDEKNHSIILAFIDDLISTDSLSPDSLKLICIGLLEQAAESLGIQYNSYKLSDFKFIVNIERAYILRDYMSARLCQFHELVAEQKSGFSYIVSNALAFIDSNISCPITLSEIAKAISVSPSYLSAQFRKQTGENCIAHINRKKVDTAKVMLRGKEPIYKIAYDLGYDNSNYFSKVFKKYTDMTPEQYRKVINTP